MKQVSVTRSRLSGREVNNREEAQAGRLKTLLSAMLLLCCRVSSQRSSCPPYALIWTHESWLQSGCFMMRWWQDAHISLSSEKEPLFPPNPLPHPASWPELKQVGCDHLGWNYDSIPSEDGTDDTDTKTFKRLPKKETEGYKLCTEGQAKAVELRGDTKMNESM